MPEPVVDQKAQQEFARRMLGIYTGAVLTKLIPWSLRLQIGPAERGSP
jgi:hypothetical protein